MKAQLKNLEDGKVKIQIGKVLTTFKVNENGTVTIFEKDGTIKDFHFEESSIEVLHSIYVYLWLHYF